LCRSNVPLPPVHLAVIYLIFVTKISYRTFIHHHNNVLLRLPSPLNNSHGPPRLLRKTLYIHSGYHMYTDLTHAFSYPYFTLFHEGMQNFNFFFRIPRDWIVTNTFTPLLTSGLTFVVIPWPPRASSPCCPIRMHHCCKFICSMENASK
jgi:hypothetical protein